MSLLDRFFHGDIRSLSRLVSQVENRTDGYLQTLEQLYPRVGKALRIGVTGPPGSGKSTLVNQLTHEFLKTKNKVGIIAVDPSSPFTGGALLGDRVRMNEFPTDGTVYFRSMATRGATGGLAAATDNVTVVYDAFGFDITLIETVGVGQVELDIIDTCDVVVVVIVPESGDAVQTMKAGLMEIADIFCVNKSDRPGAERIGAELRMAMETRKRVEGKWAPSVIATEAVNRKGIDKLHGEIQKFVAFTKANGQFADHRRRQVERKILSILKWRFQQEYLDQLRAHTQFESTVNDILAGKTNPFRVGEELYQRFKSERNG